jgi:hypothetical protein
MMPRHGKIPVEVSTLKIWWWGISLSTELHGRSYRFFYLLLAVSAI